MALSAARMAGEVGHKIVLQVHEEYMNSDTERLAKGTWARSGSILCATCASFQLFKKKSRFRLLYSMTKMEISIATSYELYLFSSTIRLLRCFQLVFYDIFFYVYLLRFHWGFCVCGFFFL